MSSRFQFVDDHRGAFGVKRLCRMLYLSRSGFYRWLAGADARAERVRADTDLAERITAVHVESDGTYGAPRVTAEPRDTGVQVNHKRVARVMRARDVVGFHLRKKARTTVPEPSATPVPDLLRRDFTAKGTELSRWSSTDLEAVAMAVNNRPRKTLGRRTPAEVFEEQMRSLQQPGVATTR